MNKRPTPSAADLRRGLRKAKKALRWGLVAFNTVGLFGGIALGAGAAFGFPVTVKMSQNFFDFFGVWLAGNGFVILMSFLMRRSLRAPVSPPMPPIEGRTLKEKFASYKRRLRLKPLPPSRRSIVKSATGFLWMATAMLGLLFAPFLADMLIHIFLAPATPPRPYITVGCLLAVVAAFLIKWIVDRIRHSAKGAMHSLRK